MKRRVEGPLSDLAGLLISLGDRRLEQVPVEGVARELQPVFESYNQLAARLNELEAEHRDRARILEDEVRSATGALLGLQRSLARAERLAAVGETAATLAHELRNPLAAVLMTLSNITREIDEPEVVNRLEIVKGELERLTRMLNETLFAARHALELDGDSTPGALANTDNPDDQTRGLSK